MYIIRKRQDYSPFKLVQYVYNKKETRLQLQRTIILRKLCPNLMNFSRVFNPQKTGFNLAPA